MKVCKIGKIKESSNQIKKIEKKYCFIYTLNLGTQEKPISKEKSLKLTIFTQNILDWQHIIV